MNTIRHYPRIWFGLQTATVYLMFILVCIHNIDPDFGWHIQSGNYFRAHGIPSHDVFTYTAPNFPWIDHEWGNDVLVSILYPIGGYGILVGFFASLWTAACLLAVGRKASWFVPLTAVTAVLSYAGVRPIAWTVLFFAVVLRIVLSNRRWLIWWLPLLFVVWANVHAGFIAGLALLSYYALRQRRWQLGIVLLLCTLASFVNPYGVRIYVEVARTIFDTQTHRQIQEWRQFHLPRNSWPFIAAWLTALWLGTRRRLSDWLGIAPLLFLMTLSATRNMPLFVIAALRPTSDFLRKAQESIPSDLQKRQRVVLSGIRCFLAVVVIVSALLFYLPWKSGANNWQPTEAVAYLSKHRCSGNIFNIYDFGGYLIWKLPGQPVFIDGRMTPWRDPTGRKYLTSYTELMNQPATYWSVFQAYHIRCAVLNNSYSSQALARQLETDGWRLVVHTEQSSLLLAPS